MNGIHLFVNIAGLSIMIALCTGCKTREGAGAATGSQSYRTIGSIERLDPKMDKLVPAGARLEVLAEGFDWSEGPVWVPGGKYLLFSDIPPNSIFKWEEDEGLSLYLKPSGYTGTTQRSGGVGSNGLLLDTEGRLVLCQQGDRRMARLDASLDRPEPRFITLADRYQGKRLNSPNDAVYHSGGDLYFTDPPYGLYRLSRGGRLTLLTKELSRPNGIAFSPDEKTLYVSNYDRPPVWMAYDVQPDGSIANGRVFCDATEWAGKRPGLCDGLKVDQDGNLFATGPGGVWVLAPDGTHLGTILIGQRTSNCAFGDDGSTLYITADMYLLRIRLNTKGAGF